MQSCMHTPSMLVRDVRIESESRYDCGMLQPLAGKAHKAIAHSGSGIGKKHSIIHAVSIMFCKTPETKLRQQTRSGQNACLSKEVLQAIFWVLLL